MTLTTLGASLLAAGLLAADPVPRPGDANWPRVWVSYGVYESFDADFASLRAAGVGMVGHEFKGAVEPAEVLARARRTGMHHFISLPEITEDLGLIRKLGLEAVPAVMIGGVYQGQAIDRHLFTFSAGKQEVLIEPPVYSPGFPYVKKGDKRPSPARFGHYYPEMGAPLKAEVIVPLKRFDGRQHLRIIPATWREAPADAQPAADSLPPGGAAEREGKTRKLYLLSFDLSELDGAMLDHVGLAVYWTYNGYKDYWMFSRGCASPWAESTREALRREVRRVLGGWSQANGGTFPHDVVWAARFGDECFLPTGHSTAFAHNDSNAPAVNYPLWDYSAPSLAAFRTHAGEIEPPRTWGFPEIYGPDAYAWWLYTLHEGCAQLCGIVREEAGKAAPGVMVFRNTTRMGIFDLSNDHDGSGQELLTQNLDLVHLDPYPVNFRGYSDAIKRDMPYCAGLARRYNKPLVPWLQSHTYLPGALSHVKPADVERMFADHLPHAPDAIIWLGWGKTYTFPATEPESWRKAIELQKRFAADPPKRPEVKLAVLRPYRHWAQLSVWKDQMRNPADWMLQQFLDAWAIDLGRPYDVFELPPDTPLDARLIERLKPYAHIVSTQPLANAWVIGDGTEGTARPVSDAAKLRREFLEEIKQRGW